MPLGRQERQRRRLAQHRPDRQLVIGLGTDVAERAEQPRRVLGRMHDQPREHLRPDRMQPEPEGRDDAEIAAAAADRPEQVRVLLRARMHDRAVGRHQLGREQVVDRQPVLARDPAEAAAERQPGDPGRRVDARRHGEPVELRLAVDIAERRAGIDLRRRARPDRHAPSASSERSSEQRAVRDGEARRSGARRPSPRSARPSAARDRPRRGCRRCRARGRPAPAGGRPCRSRPPAPRRSRPRRAGRPARAPGLAARREPRPVIVAVPPSRVEALIVISGLLRWTAGIAARLPIGSLSRPEPQVNELYRPGGRDPGWGWPRDLDGVYSRRSGRARRLVLRLGGGTSVRERTMTQGSYRQFCPVAMAAETLCKRWTILIIREMVAGSNRFNDLRRGVPKMSGTLLSQRLKELEAEGIVERRASPTRPQGAGIPPHRRRPRPDRRSSRRLGSGARNGWSCRFRSGIWTRPC